MKTNQRNVVNLSEVRATNAYCEIINEPHTQLESAKNTIALLNQGIDPVTGEIFPSDSPYHSAEITNALATVLANIENKHVFSNAEVLKKQQSNLLNDKPRNHGFPWTDSLRKLLDEEFKKGVTLSQLMDYFERTAHSIISELLNLELIDEDYLDGKFNIYTQPLNKKGIERAGMPWNKMELAVLHREFNSGLLILEIVKRHRRTYEEIDEKLHKIGLLK